MEDQPKNVYGSIALRAAVFLFLSQLLIWFFNDFYYSRYPSLQASENLIQTKSIAEIGIYATLFLFIFLPFFWKIISFQAKIKIDTKRELLLKLLRSKLSVHFLNNENINLSLNDSLKDIGEITQSSRAYLYKYSPNSRSFNITHQWTKEDLAPLSKIQQLDAGDYPSLIKLSKENHPILFKNPFDTLDANTSTLINSHQASSVYFYPITTPSISRYILIIENIDYNFWVKNPNNEFSTTFIYVVGILERFDLTKQIERLSNLKTKFIDTLSNQIQNPLTASKRGLNDLLQDKVGKISSPQKKVISNVKDSVDAIDNKIKILKTVLDYEAGKITLDKNPINLTEIVDSQLLSLNDTITLKDQKITFVKPNIRTNIFADKDKITFVIKTLLENASVYSHRYTNILIKLDANTDNFIFSVQDNGIGIPTSDQDKIFSPFFRSRNAAETKIGSIGISLFLSEKIIKEHGGNIGFTSREVDGSYFWFTLPKE